MRGIQFDDVVAAVVVVVVTMVFAVFVGVVVVVVVNANEKRNGFKPVQRQRPNGKKECSKLSQPSCDLS